MSKLLGIFSRPQEHSGKIHVYRDERSGHSVVRFMLHRKHRKKHLLTLPLSEFKRLSAGVLAQLGCYPEDFDSINGGEL